MKKVSYGDDSVPKAKDVKDTSMLNTMAGKDEAPPKKQDYKKTISSSKSDFGTLGAKGHG